MTALKSKSVAKPSFPPPGHDHDRCTADAIQHAEAVCAGRSQKFTPIRRAVLEALLASHRPLGAYEVIDELAKVTARPAPITVYRALDFLMENGLVHRIESRNAFLACAHDHGEASMVAFLICDRCGSVGEVPARLLCGLMFGVEFVLIFHGLQYTSASRASVFLYTAPFFVAAGAYPFLGERLRAVQWAGLAVSFTGVAFAIGVPQPNVDAQVLMGDLMVVAGAALWAATTLCVKATRLGRCPPEKALGYQVAISIPVLGLAAWLAGETIPRVPGTLTLSLMAFQAIWVVGMTFMIWFSLVRVYSASKLSAFTFITPLIGVAGGYLILHDPLTPAFGVAAVLVIVGLYLVNKPAARAG